MICLKMIKKLKKLPNCKKFIIKKEKIIQKYNYKKNTYKSHKYKQNQISRQDKKKKCKRKFNSFKKTLICLHQHLNNLTKSK